MRNRATAVGTVTALLVLVLGATFGLFAGPAAAQGYGDDPSEIVVIGTGRVNADGKFLARYTAPPEIADGYLIYAVGTTADGEPFEAVVAQVTPAFAGLSWALNGVNMKPGTSYTLEARHEPGTDLTAQVLGIEELPVTGANSRGLVGIGLVLAVVGVSLVYGARMRQQPLQAA